jgi:hypothetical protein
LVPTRIDVISGDLTQSLPKIRIEVFDASPGVCEPLTAVSKTRLPLASIDKISRTQGQLDKTVKSIRLMINGHLSRAITGDVGE